MRRSWCRLCRVGFGALKLLFAVNYVYNEKTKDTPLNNISGGIFMCKVSNEKKLILIKKFYRENKSISILTIVGVVIIISYYLSMDIPELRFGIDKWYKLLCDLSIGVLINFVFFLFQIYLPGIQREKKAFLMIKSHLEILCRNMQELILVVRHYFPELKSGKIQIIEPKAYYKLIPITSSDGRGWAREFDFYIAMSEIKESIDVRVERITNNVCFSQNDKELIDIISKLQSNSFLKDIEVAQNCRYYSYAEFSDIPKSFSDFCFIFEKLKEFELEFGEKQLIVLNDAERSTFINRMKSSSLQSIDIGVPHMYM